MYQGIRGIDSAYLMIAIQVNPLQVNPLYEGIRGIDSPYLMIASQVNPLIGLLIGMFEMSREAHFLNTHLCINRPISKATK